MKRIVSAFLVIIIVISFCICTHAENRDNYKIEEYLYNQIESSGEDQVYDVYVFFTFDRSVADMPNWPDREGALEQWKIYIKEQEEYILSTVFADVQILEMIEGLVHSGYMYVKLNGNDIIKISREGMVSFITKERSYLFDDESGLFFPQFLDQFPKAIVDGAEYKELYYGDTWALVEAYICPLPQWVVYTYGTFGDTVVLGGVAEWDPWVLTYGTFDYKDGVYYDLEYSIKYCDGLTDALLSLDLARIIGDIDGDKSVTIADVTYIQMCLAGLKGFPSYDDVESVGMQCEFGESVAFISDYDRNGERDIADATSIQFALAGIDV